MFDEYSEAALFNQLGSSPAMLEGSKAVGLYGLLPGHIIQQADADQAYAQALMGDKTSAGDGPTPCKVSVATWVRLPPEC